MGMSPRVAPKLCGDADSPASAEEHRSTTGPPICHAASRWRGFGGVWVPRRCGKPGHSCEFPGLSRWAVLRTHSAPITAGATEGQLSIRLAAMTISQAVGGYNLGSFQAGRLSRRSVNRTEDLGRRLSVEKDESVTPREVRSVKKIGRHQLRQVCTSGAARKH